MSNTKRPPLSADQKSRKMLLVFWQPRGVHIHRRQAVQSGQIFHNLAVVTAEELVCPSGHVDIVRLSFRTLAVQKLKHRFIRWGFL